MDEQTNVAPNTQTDTQEQPPKQPNKFWEAMTSDKAIFIYRFILWVFFSVIVPVLFINWKFGLFVTINNISLSGWAIFIGIITFGFAWICLRSIIRSKKYSYYKQIVKGCCHLLLPVGLITYLLWIAKDQISALVQVLCCCLASWLVAICVNPMPKWTYEQSKGETSETLNYFFDLRDKYLAEKENKKSGQK